MTDREKVIDDIERCISHFPDACRDCSHFDPTQDDCIHCMEELLEEALELLKEQEPIPVQTSNGIVHCGNCGKALIWIGRKPKPEWKYCAYCGKRVKWDD